MILALAVSLVVAGAPEHWEDELLREREAQEFSTLQKDAGINDENQCECAAWECPKEGVCVCVKVKSCPLKRRLPNSKSGAGK